VILEAAALMPVHAAPRNANRCITACRSTLPSARVSYVEDLYMTPR